MESKPEAYYNYSYDEGDRKTLPHQKKVKRDRRNFEEDKRNSEEENNAKTEGDEKRMKAKARMVIER